jgi:eukaryotic-like serine/threonine-protein kinase
MDSDPIYHLQGTKLDGGWTVGRRIQPSLASTGGNFSVAYLVTHSDGTEGFMKAFDFRQALRQADKAAALQQMSSMYVYERDLLEYCRIRKIQKVVTSVSHGEISSIGAPLETIFYIVFELADGDARRQISTSKKMDYVWTYRAMHNVSVALAGLHANGVYHQDVKPSNVLVFKGGVESKLGDLGRSHSAELRSPIEKLVAPGDLTYAPPEQLYGYCVDEDRLKRITGDLYLLGSLIYFMFVGVMLTPAILEGLKPELRPFNPRSRLGWQGSGKDVLPYLEASFAEAIGVLQRALEDQIPPQFAQRFIPETVALFRMLADPNPEKRGHPRARLVAHGNPYGLERFISTLDRLAEAATILRKRDADKAAG